MTEFLFEKEKLEKINEGVMCHLYMLQELNKEKED